MDGEVEQLRRGAVVGLGSLEGGDIVEDAARRARDHTRVAERLEVSERTLTRYYSGETSPQLSFLEALAAISGVRLAWLAAGKGNASSEPAEETREAAKPVPLPRVTLSLPGNLLLELVKSASADLPQEVREAIAKALKEGR